MKAKFWDKLAPSFDKNNTINPLLLETIKNYLSSQDNLLEIGTGTGQMAEALSESCYFIEASDFSPEMIARGKEKQLAPNINLSIQDAANLTFSDRSFEVVLAINILHVVSDIDQVLKEVHRVLKPGGYFISVVPIFKQNKLKFFLLSCLMKLMKFRLWSISDYRTLYTKYKFEIICEQSISEDGSSILLIGKKE